jgi:hypothetical protein
MARIRSYHLPYLGGGGGRGGMGRGGRWRSRYRGYRRRWPWLSQGGDAGPPSSPLVAWAQSCLAQLVGPWVPQDGILSPTTQQAITQFQTMQQLPPTGALDDDTVGALQAACNPQFAQGAPPPMPPIAPIPPLPPPPPAPAAPPPPQAAASPEPPPAPHHHVHAVPSPPGEIAEGELSFREDQPRELRRTGRWVRRHDRIVLFGA